MMKAISLECYMMMQATYMAGQTAGMNGDYVSLGETKEQIDALLEKNSVTVVGSKGSVDEVTPMTEDELLGWIDAIAVINFKGINYLSFKNEMIKRGLVK